MKKWIQAGCVALVTVLMIVVGCVSKNPWQVLARSVAKQATLTDLDTSVAMEMTLSQEGQKVSVVSDMDLKCSGINTPDMKYATDSAMTVSALGITQQLDMQTYYYDGWCYTDMIGEKYKYATDLSTIMNSLQQNMNTSNLTAAQMLDLSMTEENGQTVLAFTADPTQMNEQVKEALGLIGDQLASLGEIAMDVHDVHGTYTINKDGYYTAAHVIMSYEMSILGISIPVDADIHMTFNTPGEPVNVELPDLSAYNEIELPEAD